jgi:hypothetical protein
MPPSLAGLRARRVAFMIDRCAISRYTETSTSDGIEHTWADVATDVPCEAWPIGASAAEGLGAGAGLRALSSWTVSLPALTDVTVNDRITVSGPSYPSGLTFEVQQPQPRTYEACRDCLCELVT